MCSLRLVLCTALIVAIFGCVQSSSRHRSWRRGHHWPGKWGGDSSGPWPLLWSGSSSDDSSGSWEDDWRGRIGGSWSDDSSDDSRGSWSMDWRKHASGSSDDSSDDWSDRSSCSCSGDSSCDHCRKRSGKHDNWRFKSPRRNVIIKNHLNCGKHRSNRS